MISAHEPNPGRIFIVGPGRLGRALSAALAGAGTATVGPLGRDDTLHADRDDDVVLLCVPDDAIAGVAQRIPRGPLVGHCSGALTLDVLGDHERFSMHPLVTATDCGAAFAGAACAVAGSTPRALGTAKALAQRLGMRPLAIDDRSRALYHAAAAMASNYLVALEGAAERIGARAGLERRDLAHLARAALENWAELGAGGALTGPVARGDEGTVERQRAAIQDADPELLPLWDALTAQARTVAGPR